MKYRISWEDEDTERFIRDIVEIWGRLVQF